MRAVAVLERRIYVMSDVDRHLGLHPGTAKRWIDGYTRGGAPYPPVIREAPTGDVRATWGEFVEASLLAKFRSRGVPLQRLRPAVQALREELGTPYPLAASQTWLDVEGQELVMRVQEEHAVDRGLRFVIVRSGQLLLTAPAQSFVDSATFTDGVVSQVALGGGGVLIDPLRAAGRPAIRAVPAEVLAEAFRAGDSTSTLADLYELTLDEVEAAIRYEMRAAHDSAA